MEKKQVYGALCAMLMAEPDLMKAYMLNVAVDEVRDAVDEGYYTRADLARPNYTEITEWLGWPNLGDGGIFERLIKKACEIVAAGLPE